MLKSTAAAGVGGALGDRVAAVGQRFGPGQGFLGRRPHRGADVVGNDTNGHIDEQLFFVFILIGGFIAETRQFLHFFYEG